MIRSSRSSLLLVALVASLGAGASLPGDAAAQDTPPVPPGGGDPAPAPPQEPAPAPPQEQPAPAEKPAEKPAEPAPEQAPAEGPAEAPKTDVPSADAPTDEEDAAARAILEAAAKRQGGEKLAAPEGKLESFHVVFRKIRLFRTKQGADGSSTRQRIDSEEPGLIVDWKGPQLRTEWYIQGERPVIRGVWQRPKPDGTTADDPWLFDGTDVKSLRNEGYQNDLAELDRDRRIVQAMLEVAVLRTLLHDGSRWKIVDDPAFDGTCVRRTPPAGVPTPLRLTLWIDPKSKDVAAAKLAPNEPGESTMYYGFSYVDGIPTVKGDVLRFPAAFRVQEQRIAEQKPMDVMEAYPQEASFNDVDDAVFRRPKPKR